MNEDKRHLYRIDSLKVQQKIFDSYPADSEARKLIIKEQKIQEYHKLSRTLSSFPVQATQEHIQHSKQIIGFALLRVLGGVGFSYFMLSLLPVATTVFQTGVVFGLSMLGVIYSLATVAQIGMAVYSMKMFKDSVKQIEDRISKLKKDIF